jgi:hypothetical protein
MPPTFRISNPRVEDRLGRLPRGDLSVFGWIVPAVGDGGPAFLELGIVAFSPGGGGPALAVLSWGRNGGIFSCGEAASHRRATGPNLKAAKSEKS